MKNLEKVEEAFKKPFDEIVSVDSAVNASTLDEINISLQIQ